jgi:signal transduction histidine kinase
MSLVSPRRAKLALAAVAAFYVIVSFTMPKGHTLSAIGNITQALIQVTALGLFVYNGRRSSGNRRHFWHLYAAGMCLWLVNQAMWIYHENLLGEPVPNPYWGDIILFAHVIPWIAAVSLQPHADATAKDNSMRFGRLDFTMLMLWWCFLYAYLVVPHQYIRPSDITFGVHYNILYGLENLTLIVVLALFASRTKKGWSSVYGHLCIANILYSLSSLVINLLITYKNYYTGSPADITLTVSLVWLVYAGLMGTGELETEERLASPQGQAYWHSIVAAVAVLSMPLLAVWAGVNWSADPKVQRYRVLLTLGSMLVMMLLLFFKQNLVDRKLMHLLQESRDSYQTLQSLQDNLVQAEKLASIGRLVAGAAHEINNPLTAIVGYSDLLSAENSLDPQHRDLAGKILQQARRTKALVNNLLTFAKQTPARLGAVDLNAIADKALQLHSFELTRHNIVVNRRLQAGLPSVPGDENQLLQVCMHILGNAIDALSEVNSRERVISITTRLVDGAVSWTCTDNGPGVANPKQIFDPFFTTKPVGKGTGLGLSTSYGIIREHQGSIECHHVKGGGAEFTFTIPVTRTALRQEQLSDTPTLRM